MGDHPVLPGSPPTLLALKSCGSSGFAPLAFAHSASATFWLAYARQNVVGGRPLAAPLLDLPGVWREGRRCWWRSAPTPSTSSARTRSCWSGTPGSTVSSAATPACRCSDTWRLSTPGETSQRAIRARGSARSRSLHPHCPRLT